MISGRITGRWREHWRYARLPRLKNLNRLAQGDHIVATKNGLYVTTPNDWWKLCGGHYYGVTFDGSDTLVFQAFSRIDRGRILRITREGRVSVLVRDLPWGCHQIDLFQGRLYLTDTHNNAVRVYQGEGWAREDRYYPLGKLEQGRTSPNYAHINSVLLTPAAAYLLCHNESAKTGRTSDILVCDETFRPRETLSTPFRSAHNIVRVDGEFLVCDSLGETVASLDRTFHTFSHLTRGLSVTPRHIVVGESAYGDREQRERLSGWVNYFDRDWNPLSRLKLPGMVQEIRALHEPDLGLSSHLAASPESGSLPASRP